MNEEDCRRDYHEDVGISSIGHPLVGGLSRDVPRHDDELHDSTLLIARRRQRHHHRQGASTTGNNAGRSCLATMMMGLLLVVVASSPSALAFQVTAPTIINTMRGPIPTSSTTSRRRRPRIVADYSPSILPSVGSNNNDRRSKSVILSMSLQDVSDFYMTYPVQSAVSGGAGKYLVFPSQRA